MCCENAFNSAPEHSAHTSNTLNMFTIQPVRKGFILFFGKWSSNCTQRATCYKKNLHTWFCIKKKSLTGHRSVQKTIHHTVKNVNFKSVSFFGTDQKLSNSSFTYTQWYSAGSILLYIQQRFLATCRFSLLVSSNNLNKSKFVVTFKFLFMIVIVDKEFIHGKSPLT